MVATPTFVAPLGDRTTGDPVRSVQDSRITSSRGPLWMVFQSGTIREPMFDIAEVVADDMGMIIRQKRLTFLRPVGTNSNAEFLMDVGGNAESVWIATQRGRVVNNVFRLEGRIYELSPVDFTVCRQTLISSRLGAWGGDGDSTTIYIGVATTLAAPQEWELWKIDAETWAVINTQDIGARFPRTIAGDKDGCWFADVFQQRIYEYTSDLEFVRECPYPYADEGHHGASIGGGSQRIYLGTGVEEDVPNWRAGLYIHTLDPQTIEEDTDTYRGVRTYGPWVSGRTGAIVGGK